MKGLIIRRALEADVLNISVLKKQVFISTYALSGINIEFSKHINYEFSEEKIRENILDSQKIILVAERKDFLIGIAEIFLNSTCKEAGSLSPELNVLYVFEHLKGKGIGFKLISECENIVKEHNFPGLWLTVYHQNKNAINFYERQLYKDIGQFYFEMEGKKHENRIMFKRF